MELANVDAHLGAERGVEVRQGLVEEEERRATHDGAAHGAALALPAREGPGEPVEQGPEPEHLGGLGDALLDLLRIGFAKLETEGQVLADREVGIERVRLEHHGDVPIARLQPRHLAITEIDRALIGDLQPGEETQKGGLPAAARPDEHREGALRDGEADALQDLGLTESFEEPRDGDGSHDT